jgi:hypothetical protein
MTPTVDKEGCKMDPEIDARISSGETCRQGPPQLVDRRLVEATARAPDRLRLGRKVSQLTRALALAHSMRPDGAPDPR